MKHNYFRRKLISYHWFLSSQVGIDLLKVLRFIPGYLSFFKDYLHFIKLKKKLRINTHLTSRPCVHDKNEQAGVTQSEYFWQDLTVAKWIFENNPDKHVDVGSRLDGFVAHVASFREVEVFDVRPISSTQIPGVVFRQADLMRVDSLPNSIRQGYCDSLSCLHALEHFGLGRYGDQVNPDGYRQGLINMIKILKPGGTFYLSTPIGKERVEFNANWIFDPKTILRIAEKNGLQLINLTIFNHESGMLEVSIDEFSIQKLSAANYNLGIFIFLKLNEIEC